MRRRRAGVAPGDVLAALDELGIRYTVHGDEAKARCPNPAHSDHSPSWSCNTSTGEHNCFACGFGGSFSLLVAKVLRLSDEDAVAWVRKRGGVERARAAFSADDAAPAQRVQQYTEADLALFTCPPTWARRERKLTAEACEAYGVLWDHELQRWILPIRDPFSGKLWGWQEKGDDYFRNRPRHVPKSTTLFGFHLLEPACRAVLVESPLDAVRILSAGIPYAVASFGSEVSDAQLQLLLGCCSGVVCALDNDNAGWRRAEWLQNQTPPSFRLKYFDYTGTTGKDPGELNDDAIISGIARSFSALVARF